MGSRAPGRIVDRFGASGTTRRSVRTALFFAVGLSVAACDIVQGFKNAGDALFPPVKTYLDAPGYRLVSGSYRDLILLTSSELYVLSRGTRLGDNSLYSIRYAVPTPCSVPDVGQYWAGGNVDLGVAWIAYFNESGNSRTLHFTDTRCNVSSLTLPDAELPLDTYIPPPDGTTEGRLQLLVRSERRLLLVDPGLASAQLVTEPADAVLLKTGKGGVSFVLADGRMQAFDRDWKLIDTFAENVQALAPADGVLYFEDAGGIQRATPKTVDGRLTISVEALAPDGCALGFPAWSQHWISFFSPCAERKLAILDEDTHNISYPDYQVEDPRVLVLSVRPGTIDPPTPSAGVWAFFLRNIDYAAGTGTLVVHAPDGKELVLGERAALERARLDPTEDHGMAMIEVNGEIGKLVRWDFDGVVIELAQDVLREVPNVAFADLIADWDGTAGTLAQVVNGEVVPILERVPRRRFTYQDVEDRRALFNDFDGETGTLSIGKPACSTADCSRQYFEPVTIATGVHHPGHAFLDEAEPFLPGIGFLDHYDEASGTGRFQYSNLELGFTSIVSEGVSDFTYAGNGILYSVPYGEGAGVWLARAK